MTLRKVQLAVAGAAYLAAVASCTQNAGDQLNEIPSFGEVTSGVAPAGSNAAIVSSNIPSTMAAGDIVNAQVVVQNTGSTTWNSTNWTFRNNGANFGWAITPLSAGTVVAPTGQATFALNFHVPAGATSGTFSAQMFMTAAGTTGYFGAPLTQAIAIGGTPSFNAAITSNSVPSSFAAGDIVTAQVTVQNNGTAPWNSSGFMLRALNANGYGWSYSAVPSGTTVGNGQSITFPISMHVPAGATSGHFQAQMYLSGSTGGYFGQVLDVAVTIGGTPGLAAAVTGNTIPATLAAGDIVNAQVTVQNTGTTPWNSSNFMLRAVGGNGYGWTQTTLPSGTSIGNGQSFTFPLTLPVPAGATTGHFQAEMYLSGSNGGYFGQLLDVAVTVGGAAARNATLVSQNFPANMTSGSTAHVTVVLHNAGTIDWPVDGTYILRNRNTPWNVWHATDIRPSATVPAGTDGTFSFTITAPAAPPYPTTHDWQMFYTGGGYFGVELNPAVSVTTATTVTLTKAADLGAFWQPLGGQPNGSYIYADSFVAPANATLPTSLGSWLLVANGTAVQLEYRIVADNHGLPAYTNVLASSGLFSYTGTGHLDQVPHAPTGTPTRLTAGSHYWFVITTAATNYTGSIQVGGHTQNSGGISDNGVFQYSESTTAATWASAGLTPEMAYQVVLSN